VIAQPAPPIASPAAPRSRWLDRLAAAGSEWLSRRHPPTRDEIVIEHRKAYILPTRPGFVFAAGLIILLIGSINYALQLGFMLTFTVAAMVVVGMYHTQHNLTGLIVSAHDAKPVFAGESIAFQLAIRNPSRVPRPAIGLSPVQALRRRPGRRREPPPAEAWIDLPAAGSLLATVPVPTRRRGRHRCPAIRVATRFPFGLFRSWSFVRPDMIALVYPAPEADPPPLPAGRGESIPDSALAASGEEFGGVRPYRPGDPRRAIAWRLVARTDEIQVKLFDVPAGAELMLDFDQLPPDLDTERRLSRLTRWLLAADAASLDYGLALPGRRIAVGRGPVHRARCLEALALYEG
jgi:uncharacterized protein (DUF58 family)